MGDLTKKRLKASLIDTAISTVVSLAVEQAVKPKVKNGFLNAVALPTLALYGLEYAQLRMRGQTVGQKAAGIEIQSETGGELTPEQIIKRMVHRDSVSMFMYFKEYKKYNADGAAFPHDVYAETVIKEV